MIDDRDEKRWADFEALGEEQVRKNLGKGIYGEERQRLALQWIETRKSVDSDISRRETLALAKEANNLASSANKAASESNFIAREAANSARESADAARNNNIIATAALIAAIVAIALSIIGLFLKR